MSMRVWFRLRIDPLSAAQGLCSQDTASRSGRPNAPFHHYPIPAHSDKARVLLTDRGEVHRNADCRCLARFGIACRRLHPPHTRQTPRAHPTWLNEYFSAGPSNIVDDAITHDAIGGTIITKGIARDEASLRATDTNDDPLNFHVHDQAGCRSATLD